MRPAARRARVLFRGAAVVALLGLGSPAPSAGQGQTPAEARPIDAGRFLGFAHSSAVLQERASKLAASKDTRPEVREFAREMARFREGQLERLRAVARERGLRLPGPEEELEHRVVLQNLEPLDYLALSRRYAEVQVQALEQEIRGYEAASRGADEATKQLSAEMLPQLRPRLEAAHRMHDAVKP
jgi:predicted outer membrane protein